MRTRGSFFMVALTLLGLAGIACGGGGSAGSPPPAGGTLRVGDPAPELKLPSAPAGSVSLAEFRGRKPVLLYFSMGPG